MDEMKKTYDVIERLSASLHYWVADNVAPSLVLVTQIFIKILIIVAIYAIFKTVFSLLVDVVLKKVIDKKSKYPIVHSLYHTRANTSINSILAITFCLLLVDSVFGNNLPKTYIVITRLLDLAFVLFSAKLAYRTLLALTYYYEIKPDYYKVIALRAISQTVKVLGIMVFTIIGISILFGIKGSVIFGYISAFTAVFFLIYRDFILGFITGVHVATSRTYKVGDWIGVDKYEIEGTILDISLLTTKIKNFDKTISTIPTYDLLNTEVKNYEVMKEGNKRRIKKSMIFNIHSFNFITDEQLEQLMKINIIKGYLMDRKQEMEKIKAEVNEPEQLINTKRITNIGTFRKYIEEYLKAHDKIDHNETIIVRQLEMTPQGMPLEIYCFTNFPELEAYEIVQADIFDHLFVVSKEFGLEIIQMGGKM